MAKKRPCPTRGTVHNVYNVTLKKTYWLTKAEA